VTVTVSGPPGLLSASTVQNGTTVAEPAGVLPGDLLIASLEVDANPVTVTGPSGWTRLLDTTVAPGTSSQNHAQVWYKVATASEPRTYSWGVPTGVYTDIAVMDYMNVSQSSPVDASAGRDAGVTNKPTTPSVTTTTAGDMVIAIFQGAGLQPGTLYHYRVRSANASGSPAVSGDFTFTTAAPTTGDAGGGR